MRDDVGQLLAMLARLKETVETLQGIVPDLHSLAYDRPRGGDDTGIRSSVQPDPLAGDEKARALWHRLERQALEASTALVGIRNVIMNHMSRGEVNDGMYGSMLHPEEFARVQQYQRRRITRGEYTPKRTVDQPNYPKMGEK